MPRSPCLPFLFAAVVLVALVPTCSSTAAQFATRVTTNLASLFTFHEGQLDESSSTVGDVFNGGRVVGNLTADLVGTTWSVESVGLRFDNRLLGSGVRVQSQGDLSASLYPALRASEEVTVEMWLRVDDLTQHDVSPFTMGRFPSAGGGEEQMQACVNTEALQADELDFRWRLEEASLSSGYRLGNGNCLEPLETTLAAGLRHVVYTQKPSGSVHEMRLYVDGALRELALVNNTMDSWGRHGSPSKLQLAPIYLRNSAVNVFQGEVLMLAIYTGHLEAADVSTNFAAGVPNSLPYGQTSEATTTEDARGIFQLEAADVDAGDTVTMAISELPDKGTLYEYRGDEATSELRFHAIPSNELPFTLRSNWSLAFLADLHENGNAYTTFDYRLTDTSGRWSRPFTVTVHVVAANDPPVPTSGAQRVIRLVNSSITLTGTDIDAGDSVVEAIIQTLPNKGDLYQSSDGTTPGARITQDMLPVSVNNTARRIIYTADQIGQSASGLDVLATDEFNFTVVDSRGAESLTQGRVLVEIENNLQGTPGSTSTPEDTIKEITLSGTDAAFPEVEPDVYITAVPLAAHGTLHLFNVSAAIEDSQLPLLVPRVDAGKVEFHPAADVSAVTASFRFYVDDGSWRSPEATYEVVVTAVNDRPRLWLDRETQDLPESPEGNRPIFSIQPQERLSLPIALEDPDPVSADFECRISVSEFDAAITLNISAIAAAPGAISFRIGDGVADTNMLFTAPPDTLRDLLATMTFQASLQGYKTVTITVNDQFEGSGGELSQSLSLEIEVQAPPGTSTGAKGLTLYLTLGLYGLGLCCPLCCCCYLCFRGAVRRAVKKERAKALKEAQKSSSHVDSLHHAGKKGRPAAPSLHETSVQMHKTKKAPPPPPRRKPKPVKPGQHMFQEPAPAPAPPPRPPHAQQYNNQAYAPQHYTPGGYAQQGVTPGGYTPGGYTPGGYDQQGVTPGGYTPGGYTPGGYEQGYAQQGVTPGGYAPAAQESPHGQYPTKGHYAQPPQQSAFDDDSFSGSNY